VLVISFSRMYYINVQYNASLCLFRKFDLVNKKGTVCVFTTEREMKREKERQRVGERERKRKIKSRRKEREQYK
jgi:hypothetical protein